MEIKFSSDSDEPPQPWKQLASLKSKLTSALPSISSFQGFGEDYLCSVILTSDERIMEINREFRNKNNVTDVITFPFPQETMPGEPLAAEVYICQEQAVRQAELHGNSIFEEFSLLLAHGLIHAIGIDHENSEIEKSQTLALEKELLNLWGVHAPSLTTYG